MKKIRLGLLLLLVCLLSFVLVILASGESYSTTFPKAKNQAEKKLLTISEATMEEVDGVPLLRFSFSVDREALAEIEEEGKVTFGALVGREANGFGKNTLKLSLDAKTGAYVAPERARMLTVYSTDGTRPVNARFSSEACDTFTVTVDLGNKTVERTESGIACLGFLIIEEEGVEEEARVLYVARNGSPYGSTPSFAGIVREEYFSDKENDKAMNEYIKLLQSQVQSDVEVLSNTRVFVCGEDFEDDLLPNERVIWVQYLPDHDPYPDDRDPDKAGIRAAYIYYPQSFDPNIDYSTSDLIEEGALRFFAYIGVPADRPSDDGGFPGIVCVHGGGGHAYAEYALEAVKQGYVSIAFDTEGCRNSTGRSSGAYSATEASYPKDSVGHLGKDSFANAEKPLTEQWLYYAVSDTVIANTVLRSLSEVDEDSVGVTGISWGGLVTTTAICYDHRFAFASPIYIAFHMAESSGISVGGLKDKPFAAALWQDVELLKKCPVPTLIISCENDLFASVDTVSKTVNDMPNATLIIKPRLLHGQQYGASLPEIYEFGYNVLGRTNGFIFAKDQPTADMGRSYTLALDIPEGATNVSAALYYLDRPIFGYSDRKSVYYKELALTVNEDGTVSVNLPEEARVYFISFSYYNEESHKRQNDTPYLSSYKGSGNTDDPTKPEKGLKYQQGYVYSSTDIVYLP